MPEDAAARTLTRQPAVDAAKALAAVIIMLHHFSVYGPLADALHAAYPDAAAGLARYGRYAVQVFLVLGGYLAAQSLLRNPPRHGRAWLTLVLQRWWRLTAPFMAAVALTLMAHVATARWVPELLPQHVDLLQMLAHALLLHGVMGVESLTVGAWYVAIDFQLFVVVSACLAAGASSGPGRTRWALMVALSLASLWIFNRDDRLDNFALYFLGSYGLGVLVAGLQQLPASSLLWRAAVVLMVLAVALALALEWRGRLLWALTTAMGLLFLQVRPWTGLEAHWALWRVMGERAFALFLVHFVVWLLANAAFVALGGGVTDQLLATAVLSLACVFSMCAADVFYRLAERPAARLLSRRQRLSTG